MPYHTPSTPVIKRSPAIVPDKPPTLACLSCGDAMEFVRTIPKLGVLPELLVFHCPSCKDVDTMELMSTRHETVSNVSEPLNLPKPVMQQLFEQMELF
jgi:hypothetical protein